MTRRGWVLFGALSVIWGIPYLLIKIAVTDVDPLIVAFGRTLIAALLLLPIALYRRALIPVFRRWKLLLVYTVVEISGPWLLLGHAETDPEQFDGGTAAGRGADDRRDHPDRDRPRPVRLAAASSGWSSASPALPAWSASISSSAIWRRSGAVMLVAIGYAIGPIIINRRPGRPAADGRHHRRR